MGPPTVSGRRSVHVEAWRLAWPLILSNLSYPLLGVVDTAVVGHLAAPHHLGAVAVGALTIGVLYFVLGFLRMSTTGLTAQAFGRGDGVELRAGLLRGLALAQLLALTLLLLGGWLVPIAAALFRPSVEVAPELASYLRVGLWGAPAALTNLVLLGWMLGLQNARGPMLLLIVTNGLNAVLDLVLVLGLGLGVAGVAWATVTAHYGGLALGLWLVRRQLRTIPGRWPWRSVGRGAAFRRLLAVNRDILLRSLSLEAAFLAFTALSSRQGDLILAANAVLLNFMVFAAFGLDGFAHATEAMVGRAVGGRDLARFRAVTRANMVLALGLALLLAALFALGGPAAIRGMTSLADVRTVAVAHLPHLIALPVVAVWAYLLDGIFLGATRTAEMRNGSVLALATFLLAAWALMPTFGNHGLWLALNVFLAVRGLWLGLIYLGVDRRGAWVPASLSAGTAPRAEP